MKIKKIIICPICKGSGQRLIPTSLIDGKIIIMSQRVCVKCKGLGETKNK